MAESDWTIFTGSLTADQVRRGVSAGFAPPNGGGSFVFGFHSMETIEGVVAYHYNAGSFSPLTDDAGLQTGGSISAAIKRGPSAAPTDYAPFLFVCAQGTTVADNAYILGLSDNDPSQILLRKGSLSAGMKLDSPGILAVGTDTYSEDTWVHLRLDVIVNPNSDVVIRAYYNDLSANPVTSPVWVPVPGIDKVIDDALGAKTGSTPFSGGYIGFGFYTKASFRLALFDHITVDRQRS